MNPPLCLKATFLKPTALNSEDFNDNLVTAGKELQQLLVQCINGSGVYHDTDSLHILMHSCPYDYSGLQLVTAEFNREPLDWFISHARFTFLADLNLATLLMILRRKGIAEIAGI